MTVMSKNNLQNLKHKYVKKEFKNSDHKCQKEI